jgi:glycosyltransferase involved in cell wall biosynthesis
MDQFLFWMAAVDLLICVLVGYRLMWTARCLRQLVKIEPLPGEDLPTISVVVAARNEQRHIETALQSLLNLDYPNLEIIVVNDRSTDETGNVLKRMATRQAEQATTAQPRLRIVDVQELPPGWLGKNHALFRGASEAQGEYLLFTDADIVMDPSVIRRAMRFVLDEKLDHLAMMFRIQMPNWFLESFVATFSVYFFAHFKPWKVRDPKSKAHIGVGGFNLLRTQAYHDMGTHRAIAMRPDDDLKLGKLVKLHGFRQDVLLAPDLIYVSWYSSLRELIVGLEKNAFAGVDYNILAVVLSSILILMLHAFPFMAVFFTTGWTQVLMALVCVSLLLICAHAAHSCRLRISVCLGFPLAVLLFAFIQWRTMILNLWQGGIRWRDTFYPLAELKANKV